MNTIPGIGLVRGMSLTLRRFFQPKATIKWPEEKADVAPKFRGRLQLLYDEYGTLKCETCFQCAQACPIECIDMGGVDTKGRFHVHWGAPETYGESPLNPEWSGDRVRDAYEIRLFREFVRQGKPVLGICRGCQLINVAFGGTLYQDIQTQPIAALDDGTHIPDTTLWMLPSADPWIQAILS